MSASAMLVLNQSAVTMLNSNTQGAGTLGTLDTTLLANGSYWLQLDATNTSNVHQNNIAMITVAGTLLGADTEGTVYAFRPPPAR